MVIRLKDLILRESDEEVKYIDGVGNELTDVDFITELLKDYAKSNATASRFLSVNIKTTGWLVSEIEVDNHEFTLNCSSEKYGNCTVTVPFTVSMLDDFKNILNAEIELVDTAELKVPVEELILNKDGINKVIDNAKNTYPKNKAVDSLIECINVLRRRLPNFLKIKKFENPTTGRILEVVDKRPAVAVMVVNEEMTEGIFVKQYRAGCKDMIWECPAGVVESYQTYEEAAYAELRQEIGLEKDSIISLTSAGKFYSSVGYTNEIKELFIAVVKKDVVLLEQELDEGENLSYQWLDLDVVDGIPLNEIMPLSTAYLLEKVRATRAMRGGIEGYNSVNKF